MATFNTVAELIQILHEEPYLREELRAVLLTQELLDLPASHAALTEEVRALSAELREFITATNRRLESIEREMSAFREEMGKFRHELSGINMEMMVISRDVAALSDVPRDVAAMHEITRGLQRDFGDFKGNYAESEARKQAFAITGAFGRTMGRRLRPSKILTFEDLLEISEAYEEELDIPDNEMDSFHRADLMILASERRTGENPCYIAVEASYTCDSTDTDRAIKHAELLRKFTQLPAYAAIAGIHRNDEIMDTIHKGDVFWFELDYGRFAP